MTLKLEVQHPDTGQWITVGSLKPGEQPGSLSDNKEGSQRDIYVFKCTADDRSSVIYKSDGGIDVSTSSTRIISTHKLPVIKRLRKNETFELVVKTDNSGIPSKLRFTHE